MEPLLVAKGLCKRYPDVNALDQININVGKGHVVGLLGSNGSGKSTLLRIAAGLSTPTAGSITIKGLRPGIKTKAFVSYSPDDNFLYNWMTVQDTVNFFADLFPGFSFDKANELLDFMDILATRRVGALSKGMVMRLRLVLAMSWSAEVVLLDEPLSGIDPPSRDKVIEGVLRESSEEKTIIVATHLVNEVEPILSHAIFLDDGKVVLKGDAEVLREEYSCSVDQLFRRKIS